MFMAFSLLALPNPVSGENSPLPHPAQALMLLYADEIRYQNVVIPYIVNIIAIYELTGRRHTREVKNYILWYLEHLNYPDRQGLTHTIDNYEISADGRETAKQSYDSVDGYAGTFLYLLNMYHLQTGDSKLISGYWEKIKGIAYLIPYLQKKDGLTVALIQDSEHTKYLMDNCEAYAGMLAFQNLASRIGRQEKSFYADTAAIIQKSVLEIFYRRENDNFDWAIDNQTRHASDWSVLYPDALAQIFPVYYGLLERDPKKKKRLWKEFDKRYKNKIKDFSLEQRMMYELTQNKLLAKKTAGKKQGQKP